jgi:hypothetical protein
VNVHAHLFVLSEGTFDIILSTWGHHIHLLDSNVVEPAVDGATEGTFPAVAAICANLVLEIVGMDTYSWHLAFETFFFGKRKESF